MRKRNKGSHLIKYKLSIALSIKGGSESMISVLSVSILSEITNRYADCLVLISSTSAVLTNGFKRRLHVQFAEKIF